VAAISLYYDEATMARAVSAGHHRELVGGLWDEIGRLQFDFLRANGLSASSTLLDIGCGCLRAGVHFVDFLDAGHYFGTDISQPLLDAGYEVELRRRGLCQKLPRQNLVCDGEFDFSGLPLSFDFVIAQSLFTHLPASCVRQCFARLGPKMKPGGRLFATFFIVPEDHPAGAAFTHPHGVTSAADRDPYHYRFAQIRQLCGGLPWVAELIGDWQHPRDQQMVLFRPPAG
jgi:SAM-dependent methyltransferase